MIRLTLFLFLLSLSYGVSARDVNVQNRGPVNISNGHFIGYQFNNSSTVKQIYYDKVNQYLLVDLDGAFYHHCAVPIETVNVWISLSSIDEFYSENVQGSYDCRINPMPEYR